MSTPEATPERTQASTRRSKRLYLLWAIALTLLLAAGAFCWAVVVPVWRTRGELQRVAAETPIQEGALAAAISRLGGREAAVRRIAFYLKLPCRTEDLESRWAGVWILGECGEEAVPVLESLRDDFDPKVKMYTVEALRKIKAAEAAKSPK